MVKCKRIFANVCAVCVSVNGESVYVCKHGGECEGGGMILTSQNLFAFPFIVILYYLSVQFSFFPSLPFPFLSICNLLTLYILFILFTQEYLV